MKYVKPLAFLILVLLLALLTPKCSQHDKGPVAVTQPKLSASEPLGLTIPQDDYLFELTPLPVIPVPPASSPNPKPPVQKPQIKEPVKPDPVITTETPVKIKQVTSLDPKTVKAVTTKDPKSYVHPRAVALFPTINKELDKLFPELLKREYIPGLIEHESCVSLSAAKCWNSESELKTSREQGVGLGQLTRAWNTQGALRFDNLDIMRKKYPGELKELEWLTFKDRPDLQIKTILLMLKDDYVYFRYIKSDLLRLQLTDSAYNGGRRDAIRARDVCGLTKGCDVDVWFDHIEKHCVKSKVANSGYGGRNACDINNGHVRDVFLVRMDKFKPYMYP